MTTEIAITVAAVSVAFAAGVVWPDVARRRPRRRTIEQLEQETGLPFAALAVRAVAAEQRAMRQEARRAIELDRMEVAEEIAATAEEASQGQPRKGHSRQPRRKRRHGRR